MAQSTWWIVAIALGAVIVAVANIQYNRSREAETKTELALQAFQLLQPELERNNSNLPERIKDVSTYIDPNPPFETTAWQTVSNSQFLAGIDTKELTMLLEMYYQMINANNLHSRYMNSVTGVESALQSSKKTKALLQGNLKAHYDRIQNQLNTILPIIKEITKKG